MHLCSELSSAPETPARACEAVVNEYEQANSPLRMRPAQQELLKVRHSCNLTRSTIDCFGRPALLLHAA